MLRSIKGNGINTIYVPPISMRGTQGGQPACPSVGTQPQTKNLRKWQYKFKVDLKLKGSENEE